MCQCQLCDSGIVYKLGFNGGVCCFVKQFGMLCEFDVFVVQYVWLCLLIDVLCDVFVDIDVCFEFEFEQKFGILYVVCDLCDWDVL